MNTHTKEELVALDISNRTETVLIAKKVLTLRNFVQSLERKCQEMQEEVDDYKLRMGHCKAKDCPAY